MEFEVEEGDRGGVFLFFSFFLFSSGSRSWFAGKKKKKNCFLRRK